MPPMLPNTPPKPVEWPKQVGGRSVSEWIGDLKSTDPTVRDFALRIIPQFGPEGRKLSSKQIIALIDDPDPGIRINAILLFTSIGFDNKDDAKLYAEALRAAITKTAAGSMIRLHAARALSIMGPEGHPALGALLLIAEDPAWETRQAVAAAIGRVGVGVYEEKPANAPPAPMGTPPKPPAIKRVASKQAMDKLVLTMIKDASANVRMEALQALLVLGPPVTNDAASYIAAVKPYLQPLSDRLKAEKDRGVLAYLYLVTIMFDDRTYDQNVAKIAALAASVSEPAVRVHALNALAVIGAKAKPALPEIRQCLKAQEYAVVVAAVMTIVAMQEEGKYAIPELNELKAATKEQSIKQLVDEAVKTLNSIKEQPKK
jgi:hypothetical protein